MSTSKLDSSSDNRSEWIDQFHCNFFLTRDEEKWFLGHGRGADKFQRPFILLCFPPLFLGLVSSEAYNGSFGTTPFNFKPYGVQDVHIDFCGQTVPGRPMNLDFENNKFVEAYVQLQETLGHTRNNFSCNSIDIGMLRSKGYTIFGFELSPVAQDNSLFELVRQTNVCVRLNFKTETPVGGLYCVVYAEFDQIFALDFMRNSIIDSIV